MGWRRDERIVVSLSLLQIESDKGRLATTRLADLKAGKACLSDVFASNYDIPPLCYDNNVL